LVFWGWGRRHWRPLLKKRVAATGREREETRGSRAFSGALHRAGRAPHGPAHPSKL